MKGLKKLALATVVISTPFAVSAMESMNDDAMSEITGQDGITIESSSKMEIDSVMYTDAGSVTIDHIIVGVYSATSGNAGGRDNATNYETSSNTTTIDVVTGFAKSGGGTGDALQIGSGASQQDIHIQGITFGTNTASIGTIDITGMSQNGGTTTIYAH